MNNPEHDNLEVTITDISTAWEENSLSEIRPSHLLVCQFRLPGQASVAGLLATFYVLSIFTNFAMMTAVAVLKGPFRTILTKPENPVAVAANSFERENFE